MSGEELYEALRKAGFHVIGTSISKLEKSKGSFTAEFEIETVTHNEKLLEEFNEAVNTHCLNILNWLNGNGTTLKEDDYKIGESE